MSRDEVRDAVRPTDRLTLRRRLFEGLPVSERTVDVDGVSTRVVEGGDGTPLLLLHGQGGSALAWLLNIGDLAADHHVIVPDLPGLGESVVQTGELDADRVVSWLHALAAATCDEPPTVVGASLGGSIAARFAISHPDALRRLVLTGSGSLAPFRPDPRVIPALLRVSVRPTERNIERFFRHVFVDLDQFIARMGRKWPLFVAYGRERNATPAVQAANRAMLRRVGMRRIPDADLELIHTPVTLIWGRHDLAMKLAIAESASARFGWPLRVLDDCGHAASMDQPDAFVAALRTAMAA